jgi:hypothetical protein
VSSAAEAAAEEEERKAAAAAAAAVAAAAVSAQAEAAVAAAASRKGYGAKAKKKAAATAAAAAAANTSSQSAPPSWSRLPPEQAFVAMMIQDLVTAARARLPERRRWGVSSVSAAESGAHDDVAAALAARAPVDTPALADLCQVWRKVCDQQAAAAAASNDGTISILDSFDLTIPSGTTDAADDDDAEEEDGEDIVIAKTPQTKRQDAKSPPKGSKTAGASGSPGGGSGKTACGTLVLVEGAAGSGKSCLLARMLADKTVKPSSSTSQFNGGFYSSINGGRGRGVKDTTVTICRVAHVVGATPESQLASDVPRRLAAAGGVLRTSTRPTLMILFLLRASVWAFTLKVSHAPISLEPVFSVTLLRGVSRDVARARGGWGRRAGGAASGGYRNRLRRGCTGEVA